MPKLAVENTGSAPRLTCGTRERFDSKIETAASVKKAAKQSKAKPGRPPTYDRPRISIAARLQALLHARIKADAYAVGRSVSEEIERRLEQSFTTQDTERSFKGAARIGRPEGRKPQLNLRVPQPLYDQLQALAELRGVTVSEEAVRRLEQLMPKGKRSKVMKPLMLRLPLDVHESLAAKAKASGASLNSLIIELCK